MQTLSKIVDELREELSGYRLTDDTLLPDREYFIDKINEYRGSVLREMEVIPEGCYTTTCCNEIDCKGQECTVDGIVFKSKRKLYSVSLPNLIDGIGTKDILYLGLDGFAEDFTRVNLRNFIQADYSEYATDFAMYCRIGNSILIKNLPNDGLRFVCVTFVSMSPVDECNYDTATNYPASDHILSRVKRLVKMDVLQSMGYPKDFINDALPAMQQPQVPEEK